MTSLRVLASAFTCCPPGKAGFTGGESLLGWHLIGQIARFHQVWVLTQEDDRATVEQSLGQSTFNIHFRYVRLPLIFRPLLNVQGGHQIYYYLWQIMAYFAARKLHQEHNFNLFHHVTYANDWMASFIGALLPVPYVRGPGGGAQRTPKGFLRLYSFKGRLWERLRAAGQWFFRHDPFFILGQSRAQAILVCNPEAFNALPAQWQEKAQLFSVNGVSADDLSKFPSEPSGETHRNGDFNVLSAGKFLPIKGFQLGIETFAAFAAKNPNTRFTIVGDGPDLQRLESMVRRSGVEDKVKFVGWLPREELLMRMASADVFLFPGLRDGGGEVVVEAMSMGKPVVCLELGGPAMHVTDESGIRIAAISPGKSVQGMAQALERLYQDPELRDTMGKAARERALEVYHWDRAGERLQEIYQQILTRTPNFNPQ